ncbi:MAG: N-acetyltransferase [Hyphomonadaceae bacterium]
MRSRLMAYTLIAEKPECAEAIEHVLDRAFGPGRFAKTSERVRERGAVLEPSLSRVALDEDGHVIGVCRIWRVEAGVTLYFLGPLAVDPKSQAVGVGLAMTHDAVAACRAIGGNGVVLVGAERFFRPVGFSIVPAGRITLPGPVDPARLLWCELKPGGLDKAEGELIAPKR